MHINVHIPAIIVPRLALLILVHNLVHTSRKEPLSFVTQLFFHISLKKAYVPLKRTKFILVSHTIVLKNDRCHKVPFGTLCADLCQISWKRIKRICLANARVRS